MAISDNTPEVETSPHQFAVDTGAEHDAIALSQSEHNQFAVIEHDEQPFLPVVNQQKWGWTGFLMAAAFFVAILVVGTVAQKSLNHLAPNSPAPTSGVVVEQAANTVTPQVAYPTVYVQPSADPSQAPSPLPPAPAGSNK